MAKGSVSARLYKMLFNRGGAGFVPLEQSLANQQLYADREARGYYKIGWLERFAFGSGDLAQNFIYQTVTTYLLFFYTNVYGLSPAIAGTMFLVVRVIDAIWDPIVGAMIDRVNLRWGKYRSWMLLMAAPLTVLMILCFVVPPLAETGKVVYACITYVALSMIYTTVNVPFGALNAALTRDPQETTVLTTVRMWLVNVAQVAITYGIPTIVIAISGDMKSKESAHGWLVTIILYGIVGFIALLFSFSKTKERVVISKEDSENVRARDLFVEVARNRHLRTVSLMFITMFATFAIAGSVGTYYMIYNVGQENLVGLFNVISAVPALIILPFVPALRRILGKRNLLFLSLGVAFVGFMMLYFVPPKYVVMVFVSQFIRSCGLGVVGAFIWALIPEAIAYGEWLTGKRIAGIANALIGFFFKFGLALGGIVPGLVLEWSHFDANLKTQPESALQGIHLLIGAIPAALMIVCAIIVSRYDLTDKDLETYNMEIELRKKGAKLEPPEK